MKLPRIGRPATKQTIKRRRIRRREFMVWPYAGVLMLAAVCVIALLGWKAESGADRLQQEARAELAARDARLLVVRLERRLQSGSTALAVLASQERLVRAFADKAQHRQLTDLQREYQRSLPDAARLALLPARLNAPDLEAQPPIGYAVLDMLRGAEREGKAPPPEVHFPGQADAHVNIVQPVLDGAEVVGHILASYPLSWLQQALQGADGGVTLSQGGVAVIKAGPAQGVQVRLPVPATNWQLLYVAPVTAPAGAGIAVPLALLGVLLLIIAAVFFLLQREFRRNGPNTGKEPESEPPSGQAQAVAAAAEAPREAEPFAAIAVPIMAATEQANELAGAGESSGITVDPRILRAYDVRGVVGQGLTAAVVHAFGRAIATEMAAAGQQEIVVARDGRLSGPELHQALIEGLVASGRTVIDIGQVPTPVMHFATFQLATGAGVMVTGSHNPRDYNGLKIVVGGRALSGDEIVALGRRVEQGDFVSGAGSVRRQSVLTEYVDRIVRDATLHRPLRIVIDCGNGVAGGVAPQVFRAMGCEVEELFCEIDGNFPHHHPDPTVPANLEALISLVRLQQADVGLAFDGDGDRLGVVDSSGRIIWPDRQLMLFAREVLTYAPGGHVVFDVKCSARLAEFVTDHAGVPLMWKSGHSMIRNKMREVSAPLAGDMSGHIFFGDRWYGFDDAIYAGARLLEILSADERDSAELFAELPDSLSTPEIRIELGDGEAERIMDNLGDDFTRSFSDARVTAVDGLRVDLADSWALVRASNTEPCLVLRFEGDDQAAMSRIQEAFRSRLLAVKPDLQLPF
ncbi:MAG TPA: phosphomannomutase/phosphoglucomutase [Gammaproteobacteria bacterium]|nr:phosphomannomutase/phosphoglucomutase [Gammaproteobacteria bacterium]